MYVCLAILLLGAYIAAAIYTSLLRGDGVVKVLPV